MWRLALSNVDPFVIKWPDKWETDPDIGPVVHYLNRFLHDLWLRTGGGDDAIAETQNGELYETGVESASITELANDLNDDTFTIDTESQDNEDSWQPAIEKVWGKSVVTSETYLSDYGIYMVGNGAKVYLPEYPDIDSEVIVINRDNKRITVNGNGNDVKLANDVSDSVSWITAGKSVHFYWFEDGPYWVGV